MKKIISIFLFLTTFTFSQVMEKKIEIDNGFYKIPAIYTYDDSKINLPIVVMLHGTGSNKNEVGDLYKTLANKLIEKDISSIRFDFIGSGSSKVDSLQYTLTSAVSDTNKVIEYARSLTSGKIGVIGFSQGGTIALLANNQLVSTIVVWSATTKLFTDDMKLEYEKAKQDGFYLREYTWRTPLKIALQWYEEAKSVPVVDYIQNIEAPILAIAGKEDKVVNPIESVIIGSKSKNIESKIIYIPEANHIFNALDQLNNNTELFTLYSNTVNWFVDKLATKKIQIVQPTEQPQEFKLVNTEIAQ